MTATTPLPMHTIEHTFAASSGVAAAASEGKAGSPWDAVGGHHDDVEHSPEWLQATDAEAPAGEDGADWMAALLNPDAQAAQTWINDVLAWGVLGLRPFFQTVRVPIDNTLRGFETLLHSASPLLVAICFALLAWQVAGPLVAFGSCVAMIAVMGLGIWAESMVTLSLVLTSLVFCLVLGLPAGIVLASSRRAERLARPVLDAMQTTPAFVYLVPVVMLFGIGNVPGVIVTVVFAVVPLVRMTCLGIRQVRSDLIEAARAFGASPWQLLTRVQLPLALPSIMAGVNQVLMLSLSMVVIASMIAVGGLGQMVLRGIGRLDMGLATVGGLGIVLMAISLDRITQAMGGARQGTRRWWHTGPIGLACRLGCCLRPLRRLQGGASALHTHLDKRSTKESV